GAAPAPAVALHRVFSSNMVLQRGRPIVFSGTASKVDEVTVEFAGRAVKARPGEGGEWRAEFPPMEADGKEYLVKVRGEAPGTEAQLSNVVIGDVWVCSGQSNMEMPVGGTSEFFRAANYEKEIAAANYPNLRLFNGNRHRAPSPGVERAEPTGTAWEVCSPEAVKDFSACGYFFGRDLLPVVNVPVGLVNVSWGGSPIISWISQGCFEQNQRRECADIAKAVALKGQPDPDEQAARERYAKAHAAWVESFMAAAQAGREAAAGWKAADFDDGAWKELPAAPLLMPEAEDGVYWFRRVFDLPASLAGKDCDLFLGAIDDLDETYVNGELVGATDLKVANYWSTPRKYPVPAALLKPGRNVVAVRVTDIQYTGGFTAPMADIRLAARDGSGAVPLGRGWKCQAETVVDLKTLPEKPQEPRAARGPFFPSALYNSMIAPWTRVPIRGVIWYQGCANAGDPADYCTLHRMLFADWRAKWRDPRLPFLIVQLAAFQNHQPDHRLPDDFWKGREPGGEDGFCGIRDVQTAMLRLPQVGMAVAIDRGDHSDIHPRDKQTLGARLVAEFRRVVLGEKVASPGPLFREMQAEGGALRLHFDQTGAGLVTSDGQAPRGFVVAGADGKFVWAEARIEGDDVVVKAVAVPEPKHARYAWERYPGDLNLYNREGFPAVPFRTDAPAYLRDWQPVLPAPVAP
ncbi:MAG: hypothetical protein J6333_13110, partial [Planctomycetes bacterium]|nr:hypothetical protein [Planctomycetota bacterium]